MTRSTLVEPAFYSAPHSLKTLGPEVADICDLAGFAPDPEQRLALDVIFAMKPNNKVASKSVAVIAPRQNMKTGLFKQCALGWLFVTDERLIVWSAHEFATSVEGFRDLTELIEGCDPLRKRIKAIHRGNGDESIELVTGQRIKFKARTKTGGRGLSGGKVVLDEAFALQSTHMGTLLPLMSVQPDGQTVYGSSAGLATSEVLRGVRERGRAGNDAELGYLEWCDDLPGACASDRCDHAVVASGCRLDDEDRWHRANSQLGRRMTVEYLRWERRELPPAEFARERLGWWDEPEEVTASLDSEQWMALGDLSAPRGNSPVFAVAVAPDHSWAAIAAAWSRPDGLVQVMLVDYQPKTAWLADKLADLREKWGGKFVLDQASRGMIAGAVEPTEVDQAIAHNALGDAMETGGVRHYGEPAMNVAVRAARWKPQGNTRVLDRKGKSDVSPIVAAALAFHAASTGNADILLSVW